LKAQNISYFFAKSVSPNQSSEFSWIERSSDRWYLNRLYSPLKL